MTSHTYHHYNEGKYVTINVTSVNNLVDESLFMQKETIRITDNDQTRSLEPDGSHTPPSTASNPEQVANLLRSQANSASCPQGDGTEGASTVARQTDISQVSRLFTVYHNLM